MDRLDPSLMKLPLDEHEIATESASLDRLARRLVGNSADAEDIVQDAWLAAIESPPNHFVNVRGWLHRVTGFTASRFKRSRSTRRNREEHAARPEAAPSTLDIELRGEPFRILAGAVERLPEPYRTVVVLRYYENESVADMAQLLGRSPGTVRSQVKRGLDRVRDDLDRHYDGERTAWLSALAVALPAGDEVGVATGATATWVGAGVLACVGIPLFAAWTLGGAWGSEGDVREASPVTTVAFEEAAAPIERDPDKSSPEVSIDAQRVIVGGAVDEIEHTQLVGLAETTARIHVCTEDERAPLSEFAVTIEQLGAPRASMQLWTDSAGDIYLEDIEPGEWLISPYRGAAVTAWIRPGEAAEVELAVGDGFELKGQAVDAKGEPVKGVSIWLSLPGRSDVGRFVAESDIYGEYSVSNVDPHSWISICQPGEALGPLYSLSSPALQGLANGVVLNLPDGLFGLGRNATCRGVVRDGDGDPIPGAEVRVWVDAMKEPVTERTGITWQWPPPSRVVADEEGRFVSPRVRAERNRVIVSAPGFAPWFGLSRNNPREELAIELVRESTVQGTLTLPSGKPAVGAWVEVTPTSPFPAVSARVDESGSFRVAGLPRGACRLRASMGTEAESWVQSFELAEEQTLVLDGVLDRSASVHGFLRDARGEGLFDWWLTLQGEEGRTRRARTAEDGAFAFPACADGSYQLAAVSPDDPLRGELVSLRDVRPGFEVIELEVADDAYPSAWLCGRFTGLDPSQAFGARATLRLADDPAAQVFATELIGNGVEWCFEIGPVVAGEYVVSLDRPGFGETELERLWVGPGERRDLGRRTIEAPGAFELTLITPDGPPPICMLVELERAELLWTAYQSAGGNQKGLAPSPDGTVRGGPLPPGRYALRVRTLRYADLFLEVDVKSGVTSQLEHVLVPGQAMGLELQMAKPLPPDSVLEIRFIHEDGEELQDRARPTGAFGEERFLYTLRPGSYDVEVLLEGRRVGRARFEHPKPGKRLNRVPLTLSGS